MMLSRWRRVATGVAAGIIVLLAAAVGASFRDDSGGVSVASDLPPANVIPIAEDAVDDSDADASEAAAAEGDETDADAAADASEGDEPDAADTGSVTVIDADELPDAATGDGATSDTTTDADEATDPADVDNTDSTATDSTGDTDNSATDSTATDSTGDTDNSATDSTDDTATGDTDNSATDSTGDGTVQAPPTSTGEELGIGGGVDDAECALDRLVIYAGARRGGVAGSIRNALAAAGFGGACPTPVTVLAANCPLQFAGALGAGSGYDPFNSFVASSSSVNRETMTSVMAAVGYTGAEINILDFGFVNPDKPGEQWMAIFIPPSFAGWETLAGRAGLSPTTNSLCAASGELVG